MIREQRLNPIKDDDTSEAQVELLDRLRRPDGTVLNIFRTLAHHPDLARRWLVFGNHILGKSTLDARTRELAILRTGWRCQSEYEFGQHVLIGLDAGISQSEIGLLQKDDLGSNWPDADRLVLVAADELFSDKVIASQTWSGLTQHFTDQQLMDLVFTVGQYTLVSMALNSFGVQREADVPGFGSDS